MKSPTAWSQQKDSGLKLRIAIYSITHEIICAYLSLSSSTDDNLLPSLTNKTNRKIRESSDDRAYDARHCYDFLLKKNIRLLILPRAREQYWSDSYKERNSAVTSQRLSDRNDSWKKKVDYHRRSIAETAIFRFKTLLGNHISIRNYELRYMMQ